MDADTGKPLTTDELIERLRAFPGLPVVADYDERCAQGIVTGVEPGPDSEDLAESVILIIE